jgi:hypothetical protein
LLPHILRESKSIAIDGNLKNLSAIENPDDLFRHLSYENIPILHRLHRFIAEQQLCRLDRSESSNISESNPEI